MTNLLTRKSESWWILRLLPVSVLIFNSPYLTFSLPDLISNSPCGESVILFCVVSLKNVFRPGSINNPQIDIFLYSHHLPAWYCVDIVRRNSVLVTHKSERVKANYLQTTWFVTIRYYANCSVLKAKNKIWDDYT